MTCFLTSVRVLRMKTLVVVYDPPRTPLLFFYCSLCAEEISVQQSVLIPKIRKYGNDVGILAVGGLYLCDCFSKQQWISDCFESGRGGQVF